MEGIKLIIECLGLIEDTEIRETAIKHAQNYSVAEWVEDFPVLLEEQPEFDNVDKAYYAIERGFDWSATPEGDTYWGIVCQKIADLEINVKED